MNYPMPDTVGRFVLRFLKRLLSKHDAWMRDYEVETFKAFYLYLSDNDRNNLVEQLRRRDVFDRAIKGKIIMIGDALVEMKNWPEVYRLPQISASFLVPASDADNPEFMFQGDGYKFTLKKNKKIYVKVVVKTCKGILREIQYTKLPKHYEKKSGKYRKLYKIFGSPVITMSEGVSFSFDGMTSRKEDDALEQESFQYGEV